MKPQPPLPHIAKLHQILLFGICIASDFPFTFPMLQGRHEVGLKILTVPFPPYTFNKPEPSPLFSSQLRLENGDNYLRYFRTPAWEILRFSGSAVFYLSPDCIQVYVLPGADFSTVEIQLLGIVMAFWLENRRVLALHASAVTIHEHAVGFLSTNKSGKTSLAAALMQVGYSLLTDDILAVETLQTGYVAHPSYPAMRLWPAAIKHFIGPVEQFDQVLPSIAKRKVPVGNNGYGTFCMHSQPLQCLYLPERSSQRDTPIQIQALTPRQAVIELLRFSFTPRLVQAAGLGPQRLSTLTELVQTIPVRRLVYPSDYQFLPAVIQAIQEDLNQ